MSAVVVDKSFWDKEEFEDLVARSLLALYENKIQKQCLRLPKVKKPTDKDIQRIRDFGVYFAPGDRTIIYGGVDLLNDGLPREAGWGYNPTEFYQGKSKGDLLKGEYFRLGYLRLEDQPPPGVLNYQGLKYFGSQQIYKLLTFASTERDGFHVMKSYVSIDGKGEIHDTYGRRQDGKLINMAQGSFRDFENDKEITSDKGWVSSVLGFYQDRRHLWNVTAKEGIAKATFGVYPEEIKSLFYAREMPMTETGRKRPILHWVAAHHRRLKKGIDIDIEKHLRGINEFVYQGTKFNITRPIKEIKE